MNAITTIPFYQDNLTVIDQDGESWIAMRPVCESLGLKWAAQFVKLTTPENGWTVSTIETVDASNRLYPMTCLLVRQFFGWLRTIQVGRVKAELRDKLRRYQVECDLVLWRHFMGRNRAELDMIARHQADYFTHNHLAHKVRDLIQAGLSFDDIWRACRRPQWRVREVITDLTRLGLIVKIPSGMGAQQLDLYGGGHAQAV